MRRSCSGKLVASPTSTYSRLAGPGKPKSLIGNSGDKFCRSAPGKPAFIMTAVSAATAACSSKMLCWHDNQMTFAQGSFARKGLLCRLNGADRQTARPAIRACRDALYLPQRAPGLPFVNRSHRSQFLCFLAGQLHQNAVQHVCRNFQTRLKAWAVMNAARLLREATASQQKAVGCELQRAISRDAEPVFSASCTALLGDDGVMELQQLCAAVRVTYADVLPLQMHEQQPVVRFNVL